LIGTIAPILADAYTHAELNALFSAADFPGDPPEGSKNKKCQEWLRRANKELEDPLSALGVLIAEYMDQKTDDEEDPTSPLTGRMPTPYDINRQDIIKALHKSGLEYKEGGKIFGSALSTPSKSLGERLAKDPHTAIAEEYDRAYKNIVADPEAAVAAACGILESLCKTFLEHEGHTLPQKQVLKTLWKETAKHLYLSPEQIEDNDLRQILSGLFNISHGVGSLRTHASSAHGRSETQKKSYRITPRHARLAVHSAHTLALFIIETWQSDSD
jgi:hypothetical protein